MSVCCVSKTVHVYFPTFRLSYSKNKAAMPPSTSRNAVAHEP